MLAHFLLFNGGTDDRRCTQWTMTDALVVQFLLRSPAGAAAGLHRGSAGVTIREGGRADGCNREGHRYSAGKAVALQPLVMPSII